MKPMQYLCYTLLLPCFLFSQAAKADVLDYNHAFSYFEMGFESISYAEDIKIQGYDLSMEQTVFNPIQRSGGYTPFTENSGFYIQTSSTLDASLKREEWDIQPFGIVQNNLRKVSLNELNVLYAWLFEQTGYHLVTGMGITTLAFSRSDFQKDVGAPAFEAAIAPTTYTAFPGAISEDSTNITVNIGLKYDTTFIDPDATTRWQAGVMLGIPMYYKVVNSQFPGAEWVSNFQGFDVSADIGYAFQIYEKFMLNTNAAILYKTRPETDGVAVSGGTGVIPEVTILSARLSTGISWSF
ncbi:MAG: hypothetical protein Q9M19_00945 [Mariprofundaceae bacterium]|nr:hypothetical protein [Mariprofundaceae bacterium]